LTKQEPIEPTLKSNLEVESHCKVDLVSLDRTPDNNAFAIRGLDASECTSKRRTTGRVKRSPRVNRMDKTTRKLYDLEPNCGPEKSLKIDLDLYQMEDF
jgi:hypothetical protein